MKEKNPQEIFTDEALEGLLPLSRSDEFFEALYGDAGEGAYDIRLKFDRAHGDTLHFALHLEQRPGKCLACNLTYGLPEVFSRHPLINLAGVAAEAAAMLGREVDSWHLGTTRSVSSELHTVPMEVVLK